MNQTWSAARLVAAARGAGVHDRGVLDALTAVDRRLFVPEGQSTLADTDNPIPIPHEQVTTQPSLVARMVQALKLSGRDSVLEIGTGLGYQAAILARLAAQVYTVERLAALAEYARANLARAGVTSVTVVTADGTRGLAAHAPYDAIIVAAAAPTVSPTLVEQLVEGGRLVQPIGHGGDERVTAFHKVDGRLAEAKMLTPASFVPLITGTPKQ